MEKKVEYYTIRPSLKQYFGRKVNKSLKFDETTEDGKVHQVLDNLILTTTIKEEKKNENVNKWCRTRNSNPRRGNNSAKIAYRINSYMG